MFKSNRVQFFTVKSNYYSTLLRLYVVREIRELYYTTIRHKIEAPNNLYP